jgi:hypothetical protein
MARVPSTGRMSCCLSADAGGGFARDVEMQIEVAIGECSQIAVTETPSNNQQPR